MKRVHESWGKGSTGKMSDDDDDDDDDLNPHNTNVDNVASLQGPHVHELTCLV